MASANNALASVLRCRNSMRSVGGISAFDYRRAFSASSSCRRQGAITSFPQTSSPRLDAIIADFRQNVFLPAHLGRPHLRLIRRPKSKAGLENEPHYVEVGDEKFRLLPHDPNEQRPPVDKSLSEMVDLMKEKRDWEVLPGFLKELRIANVNIEKLPLEKVVRKAVKASAHGAIMTCIRRAQETGFVLRGVELVSRIMRGMSLRPVADNWSEESTLAALKSVESIAQMLDSPLHSGDKPPTARDPRQHATVIGQLLLLSAARDLKHMGGHDKDGNVAMYGERLMANWSRSEFFVPAPNEPADPDPVVRKAREQTRWRLANSLLERWAPVWKGMELALAIDGPRKPELTAWLKQSVPVLHEKLEQCREIVEASVKPGDIVAVPVSKPTSSTPAAPETERQVGGESEAAGTESAKRRYNEKGEEIVGKRLGLVQYAQLRNTL